MDRDIDMYDHQCFCSPLSEFLSCNKGNVLLSNHAAIPPLVSSCKQCKYGGSKSTLQTSHEVERNHNRWDMSPARSHLQSISFGRQ
ncbi:hypothetical protein F2Q69_00057812 [Brassica cretica]|uniref:Uncharacterized protein n=1 Tax=Brassica cretica TaxID=69181 RepID=A0A8S9MZU7_BRACR|nr:hypothetical protein F2Q69_00057812 [Brassica cretica]